MEAGDAALLEAEQIEIDLEVKILDPAGQKRLHFDSPVGQDAPERICFVAAMAGEHKVRLTPFGNTSGSYSLRLLRRRVATDSDLACDHATQTFVEAQTRSFAEPASASLAAEYQNASVLWQQAGESFLAALAMREAGAIWVKLDRSDEALNRFKKAKLLAQKADNLFLEVSLTNRLARTLHSRGEVTAARELLRKVLERARASGYRRGEASTLHNLAMVDETVGETHRAVARYRQLVPIWRELGEASGLAQTLKNLGSAYALLDHHEEALDKLADALELYRSLGQREGTAHTLFSIGWVHYLRGQAQSSIPVLRQALDLYRSTGNRAAEAATLDRLGTALRENGDYPAAISAYRDSQQLSTAAGNARAAANTAVNIGCLYQRWGRTEEALNQLVTSRKLLGTFDDPKGLSHLEFCIAHAERQRGDTGAALEHIERALQIVNRLRATALSRGERYLPIWLWQDYSDLYLDLLLAQHRTTGEQSFAIRAFEASDLYRARNLYELVLESQVGVRSMANKSLLERERGVQTRLNALGQRRRQLRAAEAPVEDITTLEQKMAELSLELESARAAIRAADPRFAELALPRPVSLTELQTLLGPQTLLLSYTLSNEKSTLFTVSPTSFRSWSLAPRQQLEAHAEALYHALSGRTLNSPQYRLIARNLARLLLPPGAIPATTKRLLVSADGILHYVPFAALSSPSAQIGEDGDRFLVDDFEICYLLSASVLATLRQRDSSRPTPPDIVAVFADPVFSKTDPRLEPPATEVATPGNLGTRSPWLERLPDGPLPRLPFTLQEAHRILALVTEEQSFIAHGFAATKAAVLTAHLDRYKILHFATHAFIDERFPELSGLALSRRNPDGEVVDGDLYLHEIYGLQLKADLVVASGCQTALGRRVRGDGLLSLTRGFLYAGASQVLVSLWSVNDEATANLMGYFYQFLLEGGEPAAALRSAQMQMKNEHRWRTPYYWAGFVLQGDDR